ncbi:MAG: argininosuccinate lyase [Myxococcota bacterium]|jgi:argininosuccinate lyase|nr:argininosuccinate lyase [Myxococcota bacterium]
MSPNKKEERDGVAKPWGGRFSGKTDPTVERFSASVHFDKALARYDIRGSIAHARMLAATGLVPAEDADTLVAGLRNIEQEIEAGSFPFDPALEDIHMNIEARLRTQVGAVAGRLHTGRSRNDQVATDTALFLRDTCLAAELALLELRQVLVERSRDHVDTVLPGYTHLQRAQPVRLAHHWLAYVEMLTRDAERFGDLRRRVRRSPLGAGAIAGSTLPLDRNHTAEALGFEAPTRNSMDTVASRDLVIEFLSAAAICMVNLSRISEELVLWSSTEFGFIELADAYSTGSSLMPQKKNPDVPEIVRGKSGRAVGNLVSLLTTMKGLPFTYNRDMQEDKEPLFDSAATLRDCIEVLTGTFATLDVDVDCMAQAAQDPMLLATDLAELLVREGVPFREAHEVVGKMVGRCAQDGVALDAFSAEQMAEFHPAFGASSGELLDLERSFARRDLVGGTARDTVSEALEATARDLAEEAQALEAQRAEEDAGDGS